MNNTRLHKGGGKRWERMEHLKHAPMENRCVIFISESTLRQEA